MIPPPTAMGGGGGGAGKQSPIGKYKAVKAEIQTSNLEEKDNTPMYEGGIDLNNIFAC